MDALSFNRVSTAYDLTLVKKSEKGKTKMARERKLIG